MRAFLQDLKTSVRLTLSLALLLCGMYPLLVWGIGQITFPTEANGGLIKRSDSVVGSNLIGQTFTANRYFHSRPSAAGQGYDGSSSSGSNLGPTSKKWVDAVTERVKIYRFVNGLDETIKIPGDAVLASASGLDPHISPENACLQMARVARERGLNVSEVETFIQIHTVKPWFGFMGDPGVNVLELNLSLDKK
ncbi:MAG: K(+)-transporting ATPase subunit C [Proteobacteria bacterium]|nr:MAG: K(+)-transporting ATPase subunit C [Pseudomonadota bacterium]